MKRTITLHPLAASKSDVLIAYFSKYSSVAKPPKPEVMAGLAIMALDYVLHKEETAQDKDFLSFISVSLAILQDRKGDFNSAVQRIIQTDKLQIAALQAEAERQAADKENEV